jgi:hypothetical protein
MNEYLKKFDTIRFVTTWSIFRKFLEIFHFLEFKFEFWIWAGLKPAGTGTSPDRFDRLPVKPDRFRSGFLTLVQGDTWGAEHAGYFIFFFLIHTTNLKLVFLYHCNFKFVDFFLVFCKITIFSFNIICFCVNCYFMNHIHMASFLPPKKRIENILLHNNQ